LTHYKKKSYSLLKIKSSRKRSLTQKYGSYQLNSFVTKRKDIYEVLKRVFLLDIYNLNIPILLDHMVKNRKQKQISEQKKNRKKI
jgi:hypothetical protein